MIYIHYILLQVEREEMSVDEIQKKAENQLKSLANAGNTRETASMVQSIAEVLNDDGGESKTGKSTDNNNNKKKKEVRDTLTVTSAPLHHFLHLPIFSNILMLITFIGSRASC